jgi:predicted transcriptional regulator
MAFNTFDEGINPGGMRSKNEIRILICYVIKSVKSPVNRELVLESLQKKGLANYFESSACFDDLEKHNNIEKTDDGKYILTDAGKLIVSQLENTISVTAREKAFLCAMNLIEEEKLKKENQVDIVKTDKGYNVKCTISGGEMNLFYFEIYVPDYTQAKLIRKNFRHNPELVYKTMLSVLAKDKELIADTLKDIDRLL